MTNVSNTRTTRSGGSDNDLPTMASDLEHILRSANLSFQVPFAKPDMSRNADDQMKSLEQGLKSDSEGPLSTLGCKTAHPIARSPCIGVVLRIRAPYGPRRWRAYLFESS